MSSFSRKNVYGGESLDQEPSSDYPGVARETGADCGVSDADGRRVTSVCRDPATGPTVPARLESTTAREQRANTYAHRCGDLGALWVRDDGALPGGVSGGTPRPRVAGSSCHGL